MTDLVFRYGGTGAAPYGDPFTVKANWGPWLQQRWIDALSETGYAPQKGPFLPTYEAHTVQWPGNDGTMQSAPIDQFTTPTEATANTLATMYAAKVISVPFLGLGPITSTATVRLLLFPNGATIPAGGLARLFTQNPEDQFPGVADKLARAEIAKVWHG